MCRFIFDVSQETQVGLRVVLAHAQIAHAHLNLTSRVEVLGS